MKKFNMKKKYQAFTLMEMLVAVAILAIVTTIAISTYSSYVRKGRRIDGINSLLAISLAEERYRSTNSTYGTLAQVWGGVTTSPEGYYTLSITNVGAGTFTITATAVGNQASDSANGTSCATLSLSINNGTVTKAPTACWPV